MQETARYHGDNHIHCPDVHASPSHQSRHFKSSPSKAHHKHASGNRLAALPAIPPKMVPQPTFNYPLAMPPKARRHQRINPRYTCSVRHDQPSQCKSTNTSTKMRRQRALPQLNECHSNELAASALALPPGPSNHSLPALLLLLQLKQPLQGAVASQRLRALPHLQPPSLLLIGQQRCTRCLMLLLIQLPGVG